MDTCLQLGLRSATYLFNRLSQTINRILTNNYGIQHLLHYLDNFLTASSTDSPVCSQNYNAMLTLCQLLSIIGKLSFSCKMLPAGRIFLHRLINLSITVKQLYHHLCLTMEARLDMQWWLAFYLTGLAEVWHWIPTRHYIPLCSYLWMLLVMMDGEHISQAGGSRTTCHPSKKWKELYAIVMAVHTWVFYGTCSTAITRL